MKDKMRILMTAVEAAPLVKVGGLADVVGSLPPALNALGCDARVIIPKYPFIDAGKWGLKKCWPDFSVNLGGRDIPVGLWRSDEAIKGTVVYLLESREYFGGADVYNPDFARHESEKFLFFDLAVLEALPHLGFKPDILHCHDFHCGLIPALLKDGRYRHLWPIKTLFTIHNFEYQGRSLPEVISVAGLDIDSLPSLMRDASDGDINFMVQGIINSDSVSTVSPSYAKEMATPEFAAGLYSITRAYRRKISGILNGIDIEAFNPETDGDIKSNYSPLDPSGKAVNKEYLQKRVGLPRNPNMPLVGFISRLYEQKGIGLLGDWLSKLDAQFIFLGEGDEGCEEKLLSLSARHPGKIAAIIGFDQALAKQIYAGADIFLMPSKFEPCGLGQMIAARYGTIPLVRRVGGLRDSVDAGIGFSFKGFSEKELVSCLKEAISVYRNNYKKWLKLINNCFKKDFSWKRSAEKYIKLYESLLK